MEVLKKSMYATIGIALMTREKAEEIGKMFVEEARLSETEGKQFVDELLRRAEETRSSFEKMVARQVESVLRRINVPTRGELDGLDKRVRKLEIAAEPDPQ